MSIRADVRKLRIRIQTQALLVIAHDLRLSLIGNMIRLYRGFARKCGLPSSGGEHIPGRDGGTGRRSGLKIRGPERVVGVRVPLSAPAKPL